MNKILLSNKVSRNKWKDWWYIRGYQKDVETIIPMFVKSPKTLFSLFYYGVPQTARDIQCYTMSFNVSDVTKCALHYKNIWKEVESQLFGKLTIEPVKRECKCFHGKLKTWKERIIKKNFYGQDVPYNMYCNATAVLKIESVYK